jgi:hypothetical protein
VWNLSWALGAFGLQLRFRWWRPGCVSDEHSICSVCSFFSPQAPAPMGAHTRGESRFSDARPVASPFTARLGIVNKHHQRPAGAGGDGMDSAGSRGLSFPATTHQGDAPRLVAEHGHHLPTFLRVLTSPCLGVGDS